MVVLAFGGVERAELALPVEIAGGDGELLVVAGLSHHVGESGALDGVDQLRAFFERHGGGHGGEHVFAGLHALDRVADVVSGGREQAHGFHVFVLEQFVERRVDVRAAIGAGEAIAAVGAQVADRGDNGVGMLMKLERSAEASADDADAQLAVGGEKAAARCSPGMLFC